MSKPAKHNRKHPRRNPRCNICTRNRVGNNMSADGPKAKYRPVREHQRSA